MHGDKKHISLKLYEIGAIKFGSFVLKSGITSPYYIDLRLLRSYPLFLRTLSNYLFNKIRADHISYDIICGIPNTALPIATSISLDQNIPTIFKRDVIKEHGTKTLIEGLYKKDDKCLIIEDVVTSGNSIIDSVKILRKNGLIITDACFVIDREGDGIQNLTSNGIKAHYLLKISELMEILFENGKISPDIYQTFMKMDNYSGKTPTIPTKRLTFSERGETSKNGVTKRLCKIIDDKKSNLVFSADISDLDRLLKMVDLVGPHVCCVKTHVDIINRFSVDFINKLKALASQHNFLIMEDRKFADIGNILKLQYEGGMYKIVEWADIVTVHGLIGHWAIEALKKVSIGRERACLLVAEMSCQDNFLTNDYTKNVCNLVEASGDFVMGLVCQRKLLDNPSFLHFTPGVKLPQTLINGHENIKKYQDDLGQAYNTPDYVISQAMSDIIIVGRDIYESLDPLAAVTRLKQISYKAYTD